MRKLHQQYGYTFIEALIALTMVTAITAGLSAFLYVTTQAVKRSSEYSKITHSIRETDELLRELFANSLIPPEAMFEERIIGDEKEVSFLAIPSGIIGAARVRISARAGPRKTSLHVAIKPLATSSSEPVEFTLLESAYDI